MLAPAPTISSGSYLARVFKVYNCLRLGISGVKSPFQNYLPYGNKAKIVPHKLGMANYPFQAIEVHLVEAVYRNVLQEAPFIHNTRC